MKLQTNRNLGLAGATLGFFVGFAAVSLFGPAAKKFKDVMDLDPALVGLLVAAPALTGSLLRIPFSAWVDTTGGRKPLLVLLSLSIIGMGGLFVVIETLYPNDLTQSWYPLVLALGLLSGCGIATFSVGISQVSYWFQRARQGRALGTYAGVGNIAPGLFALLVPLVALPAFGLGGAYLAWLIFLVVGTLAYFRIGVNAPYFQLLQEGLSKEEAEAKAREAGQEMFPARSLTASLAESARNWRNWALVGVYFTTFGGFIALTAWFPTFWQEYYDTSLKTAGILTAMYSLTASVIRIWGGSISDRMGGERVLIGALIVMAIGAAGMVTARSMGLSIAAVLVMALGMGVGNAATFKLVPEEVPEAVGGAAGWVGGLGALGGFVYPPILGAFAGEGARDVGYATGFSVFIGMAIVALLVTLALRRASTRRAKAEPQATQSTT